MQVFTCILCTLLVFLVSGWFFGGFYLNFWKSMSIPFEVLQKLSIPVTEHKSGKEHFEMLKVVGRVGGGHLGLIVMHLNLSSWTLLPTKLVELGNALVWGGGIHGNPVSGPHQALSHWTIQWNTYWPILTWPSPQEGGRDGKNKSTKWHANSKLLQQHFAKNCKQATSYISHKVPLLEVSDRVTPRIAEKLLSQEWQTLFSSNNQYTIKRKGCENR